jgi:hypothetical protein
LRRNLPFLPGPCQAFIKSFINEIGDDPKILGLGISPFGKNGRAEAVTHKPVER